MCQKDVGEYQVSANKFLSSVLTQEGLDGLLNTNNNKARKRKHF